MNLSLYFCDFVKILEIKICDQVLRTLISVNIFKMRLMVLSDVYGDFCETSLFFVNQQRVRNITRQESFVKELFSDAEKFHTFCSQFRRCI